VSAALALAAGLRLLVHRAIARFESADPDTERLPGRRFWVRGVAVHYRESGRGFPVVLLHGFGGSTFSFRYTEPALAARFRVITVDLPGIGNSSRSQDYTYSHESCVLLLHEFLERLGAGHAAFIGHSMGGAIALRYAVRFPNSVERLVLVASADPNRRPGRFVPAFTPAIALVQAIISSMPGVYRRMFRRTVADPAYLTPEVVEGYLAPLRLPGTAAAVRSMLAATASDPPIEPRDVDAPCLLVWGAEDRTVPLSVGSALLGQLPGARLEVVAVAGHLVLEERPLEANRLLLGFLNELREEADPTGTTASAEALS
jgi:pimeloyl-ACP methyl ester carboxylesterase